MFGWGRSKQLASRAAADLDPLDPVALLSALDKLVAQYLKKTDDGELVYPACKRSLSDVDGSVRCIWADTRLEAMCYAVMVPRPAFELLTSPARQLEMMDAFLRQPRHENTVVDFNGVPAEDLSIAIVAGLNWLDHCAQLVDADPDKFKRTQRDFRRLVELAQRWWAIEGAAERSNRMLANREAPPLMFHLLWQYCTRLAKEIALAAIYGPSFDSAVERQRELLRPTLSGQPERLNDALAALAESAARLKSASDPDDLPER